MATRAYGSWATSGSAKFRSWFDQTVSANDATTYAMTIYPGFDIDGVWGIGAMRGTLSITGKTTRTYERSFTKTSTGQASYQFANAFTISWPKTYEYQHITITLSAKVDNLTSSISYTFQIPPKTRYQIHYNANGGSGAPSEPPMGLWKYHGETYTLSSTRPTRSGYSFLGWATSSTATSASYQPGGSYTTNAAVTFYAVWKPNTYTITFNDNTGSGGPGTATKTHGVTMTIPADVPTLSGYAFKGWATSQANAAEGVATYQPGGSYTGNAAATLWAVWELPYTTPAITNFSVDRCKPKPGGGYEYDDEGEYAWITFSWSVYRASGPRYVGASGDPYEDNQIPTGGCEVTVGSVIATFARSSASGNFSEVIAGPFSTDQQYAVSVSITDSQEEITEHTTTVTDSLLPTYFPLDFNADATALGIFMPAPDNDEGIYCGKPIKHKPGGTVEGVLNTLFDLFHPVGSYYETSLPSAIPSGGQTPNAADMEALGVTWFHPEYAWGGSWELETQGQVHVSSGANYAVSGATTNTTDGGNKDAIVPYHRHSIAAHNTESSGSVSTQNMSANSQHSHTFGYVNYKRATTTSSTTAVSFAEGTSTKTTSTESLQHTHTVPNHTHSIAAHNTAYAPGNTDNKTNANMQPYIVVNRWHRTA